jgi:hypothetical protein
MAGNDLRSLLIRGLGRTAQRLALLLCPSQADMGSLNARNYRFVI